MNKFLPAVIVIALVGLAVFVFISQKDSNEVNDHEETEEEHFHIHAGFVVYNEGELVDFSADRYMNFSTCGTNEEDLTPEQIQMEKGHLHDNDGDVVHVHREGGTWRDLFANIGYEIPEAPLPVTFLNGQSVPMLLDEEIEDLDTAVFIIGTSDNVEEMLNSAVTEDRIIEVSQKSESCGV